MTGLKFKQEYLDEIAKVRAQFDLDHPGLIEKLDRIARQTHHPFLVQMRGNIESLGQLTPAQVRATNSILSKYA